MHSTCSHSGFTFPMVNHPSPNVSGPFIRPYFHPAPTAHVHGPLTAVYRTPLPVHPSTYQVYPPHFAPIHIAAQPRLYAPNPPPPANPVQFIPSSYVDHELRKSEASVQARLNKAVAIIHPVTKKDVLKEFTKNQVSTLREDAPDFEPHHVPTSNISGIENSSELIAENETKTIESESKESIDSNLVTSIKDSLSSLNLNDELEKPSSIAESIIQIPSKLEQHFNDGEVPESKFKTIIIPTRQDSQSSLTDSSYHDDSQRRNVRHSPNFHQKKHQKHQQNGPGKHNRNSNSYDNSRSKKYSNQSSGPYNNQNQLNRYDSFSKHIQKSSSLDHNNSNIDLNNNKSNYEAGHKYTSSSSKQNQKNFQNFNFAQNQKVDQECTVNSVKDLNNNDESFVDEKKKEVTFDENNNEIIDDKTSESMFLSQESVNSLNSSIACRYSPSELNNLRKSPLVLTKPPAFNDNLLDSSLDEAVWRSLFIEKEGRREDDSNDSHNTSFQNRNNNSKRTNGNNNNNNNNNSRFDNNHYGQLSRSRSGSEKNIIKMNLSIKENVKLNEAENAWKPSHMQNSKKMNNNERDVDVLSKKFRSLLNKLTEENFDHLIKEINSKKTFIIDTSEKLEAVVEILFEKSISEPGYASTYAKLCRELSTVHVFNVENLSKKSKTNNPWKVFLISRCQQEFERSKKDDEIFKDITDQIKKATDPEEIENLEEVYFKIRQRANGTVKFIGELYKMNMLTANIMKNCIAGLITSVTEENIERLCKLLTTVGDKLEDDLKKAGTTEMAGYMRELNKLKNSSVITTLRIKFDIMNVMDLRASNWKPRENSRSLETKPQKLQDLQEEEEKKKKKQQMQLNEYNDRSHNRSHQNINIGRSKPQRYEYDGHNRTSSRNTFDFNKFQIQRQDVSNMTLGPPRNLFQNFSNTATSKMAIPSTIVSNSFANLPSDCDEPERLPAIHHTRSSGSNNKSARRDSNKLKNSQSSYKNEQKVRTPSPEIIKPTQLDFDDDEFFIDLTDKESNDMKLLIEKLQQVNKGKITQEMMMTDLNKISITTNVLASVYSDLFDKKSGERKELLEIIADVLKSKLIKDIFNVEALKLALKSIPSIICDVPLAYEYFADYLIFFNQNELISLGDIEIVCQNQQDILEKTKQKLSTSSSSQQNEVSEKSSGNSAERLSKEQSVDNVWISQPFPVKTKSERPLNDLMDRINFEMEKKLKNESLEKIYSIIDKENCQDVQNFIKDLTVTLLKACNKKGKSAKKTVDLLKLFPIFIRYINNDLSAELECIDAIINFVFGSKNVDCDLCKIFCLFYDNNVISLDAFKIWKDKWPNSKNKYEALKQTTKFFQKLEEDNISDCSSHGSTVEN